MSAYYFGLSKAQPTNAAQQGGTTAAGTPGYAPLEQWVQKAVPASDVYSLAATLHHLLTGRDPRSVFTKFNLPAFHRYHANFPPILSLDNTFPAALEAAVAAALRDKPQDRPTITQWKAQLETIMRPQTTGPLFRWQDGTVSYHPQGLAKPADQHWYEARRYFTKNNWEDWFKTRHNNQALAQIRAIKAQYKNTDIALDAFLRTVEPNFPKPQLQINISSLDFGPVAWQTQQKRDLKLQNSGSGCLHGKLTNVPRWVQVSTTKFVIHDQQTISITVNTSQLTPRKKRYTANILIDAGSGGQKNVPITLFVPEPRLEISTQSLDLGLAYQGEKRIGTFKVLNRGGSAFEGQIHSEADWATISPATFRCEAGQSVQIEVKANTSKLRMAKHETALTVRAKANRWTQSAETKISVDLPWLITFWRRWGPTLDWAAIGMVLILAFFVIARTSYFMGFGALARIIKEAELNYREVLSLMVCIGLPFLFLGGWLGLLMNRQESKQGRKIAKFLLPWGYNFRGATAGSLLVTLGVWLGGIANTWYGVAPTIALAGLSGMLLWGLVHPPRRTKFNFWSGIFAVILFLPALIGWLYFASQAHNWWHQAQLLTGHTNSVNSVAWSPDSELLASASCGKRKDSSCVEGEIRLWNRNGEPFATLEGHPDDVKSVTWSPDGELLASASCAKRENNSCVENEIQLWGPDNRSFATLDGHTDWAHRVAWSPDGELLASVACGKREDSLCVEGEIRLWGRDGTLFATLEGHTNWIHSVAWSPDGQLLASASCAKRNNEKISMCIEGEIRLWERGGEPHATLKGHADRVETVAWSPNGQLLASASRDGTVRLWEQDGTPLATLEGHTVNSMAWSPDGELLAFADEDRRLQLWRRNRTPLVTLEGHIVNINNVAWSPDGQLLASAGETVRVWGRDGTPLATLQGHIGSVNSVAWRPDGQLLASAGDNDTVRLWWVGDWWWK